jgi:cysteine desulfuration protein SufE
MNEKTNYFRTLRIKVGLMIESNEKTDAYLIKGCISRAWLFPRFENGLVYFKADSEAAIVKGIIASIVEVYSGSTPAEILALSPDFLAEGGISEALSMNRRSGLANILKQVRLYALAYQSLEPK